MALTGILWDFPDIIRSMWNRRFQLDTVISNFQWKLYTYDKNVLLVMRTAYYDKNVFKAYYFVPYDL